MAQEKKVAVMGWMMKGSICFAVAIVLFAFCLDSEPVVAQSPTPTFGGDCCSVHAGPGCEDSVCTACVCDEDILCCQQGFDWDVFCVGAATNQCAGECPCVSPTPTPGGDCCSPHAGPSCDDSACAACVCGIDDVCCDRVWDATCVVRASDDDQCAASCECEAPPTPTPTPTPMPGGDCCTVHAGPQCDDSRCEECVCEMDSFCCDNAWDQRCVNVANVECGVDCPCDSVPGCCAAHEGLGCNDIRCQDCVCALDDLCCEEAWDQTCAEQAFAECSTDCVCEPAGDCCVANLGLGCDDLSCQDCVCAVDSFCCTGEWDQRCVDVASVECVSGCFCSSADCCEPHEILGCDEPTCQECVCALDPACCTDVWDDRCVSEAMAECGNRCSCGSLSDCCLAGEDPGCEDSTCESCVCEIDSACCDDVWDGTCTDIASNPDECAGSCPCGPDATPTPTATPTPGGDCCSPHAGPECDDSACQACVCGIDGACCDNTWDATCVDIASNPDDCATSCPCVSDCCFGREDANCDDPTCESCVCGIDAACCSSVWDGTCASIAGSTDECASSCMCLCPGDCEGVEGDGTVSIVDLILAVNILLGNSSIDLCLPLDTNGDRQATVDEVVQALDAALRDCRTFLP